MSSNGPGTDYTYQSEMDLFNLNESSPAMDDVTLEGKKFEPWDNPYNLMDQRTSQLTETAINAGVLPVVVIVGVITNIISAIIFVKQGLRDRINVCLFSLAVADGGYLLSLFIYRSHSLLSLFSARVGGFWKIRSLNTIIGVLWGFSTTSNLLTLLVSLERCLCVVNPFKAKHLLKTKLMVVIIVLIYIIVIPSSLIFNVKFTVGTKLDAATNSTSYVAVLSSFYIKNKLFVDIVYNYIIAITLRFVSLVVIIVSTIVTVIFLRKASSWKQSSAAMVSASERKEDAVTKMLLVVCYAYVILTTPSVVNAFVVQFVEGWIPTGRFSNTFYVRVSVMRLLTAINSASNFFIFYFRGSKFRDTFRDLYCRTKDVKK